jgi:hypothetical protein
VEDLPKDLDNASMQKEYIPNIITI